MKKFDDDDGGLDNDFRIILSNIQERFDLIEKSYNPELVDLHFEKPSRADSALFEALYSIGLEAWNVIQNHQSMETRYWFYDYFLLISSASLKILTDKTQKYFSKEIIARLVVLLIEISQFTSNPQYIGDITKRNHEALGNLLLAFHNSNLRKKALTTANEINRTEVNLFVERCLDRVKEVEKEMKESSS